MTGEAVGSGVEPVDRVSVGGSLLIQLLRMLAGATLVVVACLLGGPVAARAAHARQGVAAGRVERQIGARSAVRLNLSVGYGNMYRGTAWTPVHVRVRNSGSADVAGTLEIPQATASATGAEPDFHGLYQAPVVVPAGGMKDVTLYVPGSGIQGSLTARFLAGRTVLATASTAPIGLDTSALLIGVLAGGTSEMAWIAPAIQQQVTTHVVRLSPETVDPVSQALATFDIIVLTNIDTSQLDRAQIAALQGYVQNGGSLIVVGGPTWQETLRPLQGALLPGSLAGMRVLPNLRGLLPLAFGPAPHRIGGAAPVSVLSRPGGTVLASQAGVPLVVRKSDGRGTVEYLAFDPSLSPVHGWSSSSGITEHLMAMAAPLAITRTWSPSGFRARFQGVFRSVALTNELSNLPAATLPFLALFAVLTLGYVLILGPLNFLLLWRIRRQSLAWITIPLLGLTYLGAIFALAPQVRASSAELNTVGLVTLGGSANAQPATMYMGLATPMSGDYHLTYRSAALPAPLPQLSMASAFSFRDASTLHNTPLRMRLQEDPQTTVSFLSMKRRSIRDVALDTSVNVPGAVQTSLTLDVHGNLAGTVRNGTNLDLLDPIVVAGQNVAHLPTIRAGGSVYARVRPSADGYAQSLGAFLVQAYGGNDLTDTGDFGGFRDFGGGISYPQERQLIDRVRNAVTMISQAQPDALSALGQVMLIGWTERPLSAVSVDGSTPQRRDLTLVAAPLSIHFPSRGAFQILTGTVGSRVVDILPRAPESTCCGFGWGRDGGGDATVGAGGFLTFEFDLPTARRVNYGSLNLTMNSSQDDGATSGRVYDWRARRWVGFDLSSGLGDLPNPNRFVSSRGQLMVRILSTAGGGPLTISDPYNDVQLSGSGAVG